MLPSALRDILLSIKKPPYPSNSLGTAGSVTGSKSRVLTCGLKMIRKMCTYSGDRFFFSGSRQEEKMNILQGRILHCFQENMNLHKV